MSRTARCRRACGRNSPSAYSIHAHTGLPRVRRNEKYARAFAGGGEHHAFGNTEFHLPCLQVRNDHGEPAFELLGRVGGLDPGENGTRAVAKVECQL